MKKLIRLFQITTILYILICFNSCRTPVYTTIGTDYMYYGVPVYGYSGCGVPVYYHSYHSRGGRSYRRR